MNMMTTDKWQWIMFNKLILMLKLISMIDLNGTNRNSQVEELIVRIMQVRKLRNVHRLRSIRKRQLNKVRKPTEALIKIRVGRSLRQDLEQEFMPQVKQLLLADKGT